MWLRTKLEAVELIINTADFTKADKPYWEEERRNILRNILKQQLHTFDRNFG